jgi:hypothetical protein
MFNTGSTPADLLIDNPLLGSSGLNDVVRATTDPLTGGRVLRIGESSAPLNGTRTDPVRVAVFGDSTANFGGTQGSGAAAGLQDTTLVIPDAWNSGAKTFGISIDKFAADLFYPQMYVVACGGISGETTTAMVARDTAGSSTTRKAVTDIINLAPHVVILRGGSINDLLAVTSGTVAATVAATYANHILLINRFLSAGICVIDEGVFGFTNGTANTATDQASTRSAVLQLNALYATYAQSFPSSILTFIEPNGLTHDGTGAYISTISTDGTHPNVFGQLAIGREEALAMSLLFGASACRRFQGTNVITNALMANAAAGTATGYTVAASGVASVANKQIEVIDGKVFQTAEWTLAAGTNTATINIPFDPSAMAILVNDIYGFEFDFYFKGLNGYVPTPSALTLTGQARVDNTVGGGQVYVNRLAGSTGYGSLTDGIVGHIALTPVKFGDVSANFAATSRFQAVATITDSAGVFKMGVGNPRIVKLGQSMTTI